MLLAGDSGGTKTDLAVFAQATDPRRPLAQAEFHTASYPDLTVMVRAFLAQVELPVDRACFDVAGPVINGRVKLTNLPWALGEATLAQELHLASVHLLNDL